MKKEKIGFGAWFLSCIGCFVVIVSTMVSVQGFYDGVYVVQCSNNRTVECKGDKCSGQDYNGCRCKSNDGSVDEKRCPKIQGELLEEELN